MQFLSDADAGEGDALLVELAADAEPDRTLTTLRFRDVVGLQVARLGPLPVHFGGLHGERRARPRHEDLAIVVESQKLHFYCASFDEQAVPDATARAV